MLKKSYILILVLLPSLCLSQLSGTYTVGGSNPDFPDIVSAIDSIKLGNTAGNVVLNIRAGTYNGVITGNFYCNHEVTVQSESGLNDVTITSSAQITIDLNWPINQQPAKLVTIKHLDIVSTSTQFTGASLALRNFNVLIDSCNLLKQISLWRDNGVNVVSKVSNTQIQANNPSGINTGVLMTNCFLNNTLNISTSPSDTVFISKNTIQGNLGVPQGQIIQNNLYRLGSNFTGDNLEIISNQIDDQLTVGSGFGTGKVVVFNNRIKGRSFLYGNGSVVMANNIFLGYVNSAMNYSKILNNNFGPLAYVSVSNGTGVIKNNLISIGVSSLPGTTIENNNYFKIGSYSSVSSFPNQLPVYDSNPTFINPLYSDTINYKATNSALIGLGIADTLLYDIDSITRPPNPTLGANEICLKSGIDTLHMTCGDSVPLLMCDMDSTLFSHWSPGVFLSDSLSAFPYIRSSQNMQYFAYDTLGNVMDTVILELAAYQPNAHSSKDTLICKDSLYLFSQPHPFATYSWSPSTWLPDSTLPMMQAKPELPITYILNTSVPGCGTYIDSVQIIVDFMPTSNWILFTGFGLSATFQNNSSCFDSLYWDFGDYDSTFQIVFSNYVHDYDSAGTYYVCLYVFNEYGSDTLCDSITVQEPVVGVEDAHNNWNVNVYPNPTKNELKITSTSIPGVISVYDLSGRILITKSIKNKNSSIQLHNLNPGLYLFEFKSRNYTFRGKILKQ